MIVLIIQLGLGCKITNLIRELHELLPSEFPWLERQILFPYHTLELPYYLDIGAKKVIQGYKDNISGILSLIEIQWNIDTFSTQEGLFIKLVLDINSEDLDYKILNKIKKDIQQLRKKN
jgi:hypothetical protein